LLDTNYVDTIVINAIEKNEPTQNVLLYPNPASTKLYIKAEDFNGGDVQFIVTDIQGKQAERFYLRDFINGIYALNISQYQPGIYILSAQSGGMPVCKKFIKITQ
jgi:hypothetical protein